MLGVSPHSIARSSLEEMLDSLRRRDESENQKDLPPALPSRPTSKARLPKRLIQARLNMENVVSKVISNNNNVKKRDGDGDVGGGVGVRRGAGDGGGDGCNFGRRKMARVCNEAEWDDSIGYFVKKQLRVWCRPRNDQWELAKIKSAVGEEASVTLLNGNVITVSTRDLLPANTEILDGIDDLVELSYLNEPSVLHNLQHRYDRDVIYSKAGPVLLAINPFKDVPIYGSDFVTAYREKILDNPHVYATAEAAYDEMMRDGGNQSIIISGESGSGKTETAKFAMQYLASVGGGNSEITTKITQTSCILEAFGNAKTSTHCNSSRFGKLIDMHYSSDGKISGACIQTLPLEKSRASQICRGERSYHIFYQICAGAPSSLKDILNLKMASEYKFLNQSGCLKINGVDDAHNFLMLTEALDALKFSYQDQEDIFELLAAILWLGNISFAVIENEEYVDITVDEASRSAARLIGCEMDDLISVLSTNRANEMTEPLTLQQATNKRDALANYIYESIFSWIVREINRSLEGDKQHAQERTISIMDTYGFESFQRNSFQQLLINYAEERLQQHYIRHLCKLEQEEYEWEGIQWKKVEFEDNEECVDLFEKKPMGLISILDEDSNSTKATDVTFTDKIKRQLSSNSCFSCERETFRVRHSAREVQYDATGFLEQNIDSLQTDIVQLLMSSHKKLLKCSTSGLTNQFHATELAVSVSHERSVGEKFKDHLSKMIQQLEKSRPHFIRCIKPTTNQLPGMYENGVVLEQLRCSRIMEIVQISKVSYPICLTHQEFANRFGRLLSENIMCVDPLSTSIAILQQYRVRPHTYQVGYTKLFFQVGQVDVLENLRQQVLDGTREVENGFLGGRVLRDFHELKYGAVTLQSFVRGENARRKHNVSKLRNHGIALSLSDEHLSTIVQIQSVVRGWLARRHFIHMQRWKKSAPGILRSRPKSHPLFGSFIFGSKSSELKGSSQENIQYKTSELKGSSQENIQTKSSELKGSSQENIQTKSSELKGSSQENIQTISPDVEELQRRVKNAESSLSEREHENLALREQVRQFKERWLEYETKMKAVEETWQSQMATLQLSVAAAKKTLGAGISDGLHGRPDVSPSTNYYDSEDDVSGIPTPVQMTPARIGNGRQETNGSVSPTLDNLSREFEQRKQNFNNDAKAVISLNPGRPPSSKQIEDFKILKKNFEVWKKEYKNRLRDVKSKIVKGVPPESDGAGVGGGERRSRNWWGKLSKRSKDRIV